MIKVKCKRKYYDPVSKKQKICNHEWLYRGISKSYVLCSACRKFSKLDELMNNANNDQK